MINESLTVIFRNFCVCYQSTVEKVNFLTLQGHTSKPNRSKWIVYSDNYDENTDSVRIT